MVVCADEASGTPLRKLCSRDAKMTKQTTMIMPTTSITTFRPSGACHQLRNKTVWQYLSIVLLLVTAMGLGPTAAQAQTLAYVTNQCSTTVTVIDTANNAIVATIPIGAVPAGAAITPDGTRVYVADEGSNTISVISTTSNTVIATIPVGVAPVAIAITPDGTRAYVANEADSTISVIDTATNTVVATIPENIPTGIAI